MHGEDPQEILDMTQRVPLESRPADPETHACDVSPETFYEIYIERLNHDCQEGTTILNDS
jgi:hypothetical protein